MTKLFTIELPDAKTLPLVEGGTASVEIDDRRQFTRKINDLLVACQDAQYAFSDWHPDTKGRRVAKRNADIMATLVTPFHEVISQLIDQAAGHGFEGMDDIDGLTSELKDTVGWWIKRIEEGE